MTSFTPISSNFVDYDLLNMSYAEVAAWPKPIGQKKVESVNTRKSVKSVGSQAGERERFGSYLAHLRSVREWTDSLVEGLPRWLAIRQLNKVIPQLQDQWEVRYVVRRVWQLRDAGRRAAGVRQAKAYRHAQAQLDWANGGRERRYLYNHRFGTYHSWFVARLQAERQMPIDLEVATCEPQPEEEEECSFTSTYVPRRCRKARWETEAEVWRRVRQVKRENEDSLCFSKTCSCARRDPALLARLRAWIRKLRVAPMRAWNAQRQQDCVFKGRTSSHVVPPMEDIGFKYSKPKSSDIMPWVRAEPQMEGLAGEEQDKIVTSNVVLTEANPASFSVAANNQFRFDWHQLCTTEKISKYEDLTDRFTFFKSVDWKTSMAAGTELNGCTLDMPVDFIDSVKEKACTMPMFVPFKIFRYFKSDIEFKFHINSNKFQVGQLQFSWQYLENYDGNALFNMYSRCQLPHVLVNAGSSNEATLRIPYKYVQPYLSTVQRDNGLLRLYLGTLRCFIIAPLAVGDRGPDTCSVSIFVRFPSAEFTGMRDGSIVEAEMEEAAAVMVAAAAYDKFIGDKNCDNPSVNVNPDFLVPTASHSWSAGTGIRERVMGLRLDNSTIGVGRVGIDNSETNIGIPCRTFGMLKHFEWSTVSNDKNKSGYLLWECDANAQVAKSMCYKVDHTTGLDTYALPPVSVVTSLFRQWRGSLEFRFDIIASQFHTGRLLCAYIPGAYGSTKISLEQARNSAHVEFSLQDSNSFTFVVPYISDRVYWSRRYTGPHKYGEATSPSKLVLFVLNPLIPMESVVNKVVIVPYIRAGTDFEVSVPVQPSIGLSDSYYNTIAVKDKVYPTSGSYPYRATNYKGFGNDLKYILYEGTALLGTAATFQAPASIPSAPYICKAVDMVKAKACMTYDTFKKNKTTGKSERLRGYIQYIVLWYVEGTGNYGIPFPQGLEGEMQAKKVAMMLHEKKPVDLILKECYDYILDDIESSSNLDDLYFTPQPIIEESFEIVRSEIGDPRIDCPNMLAPNNSLPSTSGGRFNFNESFTDLKDLARRYQLYAEKKVVVPKGYSGSGALALIPVLPHGLALDVDSADSVFNVIRDGHIPIISSGYIFFRGSIRMRIVTSSDSNKLQGAKIWVQHHPDGDSGIRKIVMGKDLSIEDRYKSHSYAFYIQSVGINDIIEFEVPFYQPSMYGLTRKPQVCNRTDEICAYYTLGNIAVGFIGGRIDTGFDANVQVYYSVGDDFSFSTFRGFPEMVYVDEVWPTDKRTVKQKEIVWITAEPEMEDPEPEMFEGIKQYVTSKIRKGVRDVVEEEVVPRLVETANDIKSDLSAFAAVVDEDSVDVNFIAGALGNIAHVVANPNPRSVAIAIANVIVSFFSKTIEGCINLLKACIMLVQNYWGRFTYHEESGVAQPEGEDEDGPAIQQFAAAIFAVVALIAGYKGSSPGKFPNVLSGINSTLMLYNNAIRCIQNSGELIKYCIKYIVSKLDPEAALAAKLLDDLPDVQAWFKECQYLLDVRVKSTFLYDKGMMTRVFDAVVVGNLLVSNGLTSNNPAGKLICDTHRDMRKLQCELFERGVHPDVRFEPFPLWITGGPGIGKSFMVTRLANDLLKYVGYAQPGSLIYYIPCGAKYWSGCQDPAVLVSDDIFQVAGEKFEDELANLFAICSSSVLNPPMAAVEEKSRRINPLLYFMLSNHAFPNLSPTCKTPEAIYRRRKFLIYANLKKEYQLDGFRDASVLPSEVLKDMGHLEFYIAKDVVHPSPDGSMGDGPFSYMDILKVLQFHFKEHYIKERSNFKDRMIAMYSLDPNFDETNIIDTIPDLANCVSLKDQREMLRIRHARLLDEFNDPQRDPTAWDYIRKFRDRVKQAIQPEMAASTPSSLNYDKLAEKATVVADKHIFSLASDFFSLCYSQALAYYEQFPQGSEDKPVDQNFTDKLGEHFKLDAIVNILTGVGKEHSTLKRDMFATVLSGLRVHPFADKLGAALLDFLNVGDFSCTEYMQFLACFPNAMGVITSAMLGLCWDESCKDMVPPEFVDIRDNISAAEPYGILRNVDYLEYVRNVIKLMKVNDVCHRFERQIFEFFIEHVFKYERFSKLELFNIIKEKDIEQLTLHDLKCFCIMAYLQLYLDCKATTVKWISCALIRDKLRTVINMIFIKEALFSRECKNVPHVRVILNNVYSMKFCDVRRKLEFGDSVVDNLCAEKGCYFNNDMLYYFVCFCAESCRRNVIVGENAYGCITWQADGYLGINSALRRRRSVKFDTLFSKFVGWIQHLFFHRFPEMLSGIWRTIMFHLPKVLLTVGVATMFSASCSYFYDSPKVAPESNYFKFGKPAIAKPSTSTIPGKYFVAPQGSISQRNVIARKIEYNTVLVYCKYVVDNMAYTRSARCLMLKGRAMLILRHYWEEFAHLVLLDPDCTFTLFYGKRMNPGEVCKTSISWEALNEKIAWCSATDSSVTSNFGIVVLPKYVLQFCNIVPLFCSRDQHKNVGSKCDLYVVNGDSAFGLPLSKVNNISVAECANSSSVLMYSAYSYTRQAKGLCGSIVVSDNLNSGNGAIIGMHVAGQSKSGVGYAEPLYREMFENFFEICPQIDVPDRYTFDTFNSSFKLDSNVYPIGCVPPSLAHSESGKTKIVPSLLHGEVYPVVTEVNPLRPNDPRQPKGSNPLRDGCNKHGSGDITVFKDDDLKLVVESVSDKLQQVVVPVRLDVEPLTMQQAVCGDVEVPYFEALNWKSSEGFPLSSERPKDAHDKKWLFDLEEGQFGYKLKGLHPRLTSLLAQRDKDFKLNRKPDTVYIDCLKDYRLSPEKCKIPGKTRIFSIAPIQCSLDVRMYLNDFCASLKNSRIVNSVGIGINPDSLEWTQLVEYLYQVGDKIITLDYSNYGPTLMSQCVAAGCDIIKEWYEYNGATIDHLARITWILENDLINPTHLCENLVYETVNGISSGSPLTGELNSIPNLLYIRLAYLNIMREREPCLANMYEFDNNVRYVVYGDDIIMCVSDKICEIFNALSIREFFSHHGIKVTSAAKSSELTKYGPLSQATFLKRSFVPHPFRAGVWLAPVERASVEECINWVHDSKFPEEALLEVCRASLDLAFGHGPNYYKAHYNKIKLALNKIGLKINVKTWYDRDIEIFGDSSDIDIPKSFSCNLSWTYNLQECEL